MERAFWVCIFTYQAWENFLADGGRTASFRDRRWRTVQNIKEGDILLCYLTGISRWIGAMQVTGAPYRDTTTLWSDQGWALRAPVKVLANLEPVHAIPVIEMRDQLSLFQNMKNPQAWAGYFHGSPLRWGTRDGELVLEAIAHAVACPVLRPYDPTKLARLPATVKNALGAAVTVPDDDDRGTAEEHDPDDTGLHDISHTEIQWLLLKLGNDMGLDVWAARNDRGRSYNGISFASLPRMQHRIPVRFGQASARTIELIDVLWLRGNSIVAAFEIESTTQVFSGLLRMSDLLAEQPNINIPLFIVAPSERYSKVISEVNRPTFRRLEPPMPERCRFIAFEALRQQLTAAQSFVRYLKVEFLDSLAQSCQIEPI